MAREQKATTRKKNNFYKKKITKNYNKIKTDKPTNQPLFFSNTFYFVLNFCSERIQVDELYLNIFLRRKIQKQIQNNNNNKKKTEKKPQSKEFF